jgi:hypothetical protein
MIIAKGIKIWGCVVVVIKSFCITRFVIVYNKYIKLHQVSFPNPRGHPTGTYYRTTVSELNTYLLPPPAIPDVWG